MVYYVKDFEKKIPMEEIRQADTAAIQDAIDACSLSGGTVVTEEGRRYLIHTIVLKSGVELVLSKGTVLEASGRLDDYRRTLDENGVETSMESYAGRPVHTAVYALGEQNIGITGEGCIEGRSELFVTERSRYHSKGEPYPRPTLIYVENCQNITFTGFTLQNAPFWTLHMAGCRNVLIDSIKILNKLDMANSDGIDPDHCKDVVIRNCVIRSADDCICMKNTAANHSYGDCEAVLIENCDLMSTSAAIKIGTEGVDSFRNIRVRNCRIRKSNRGLVIQIRDSGSVSDVTFEHIEIETRRFHEAWWGRGEPVMLSAVGRTEGVEAGTIQNVMFKDIRCTGENGICIYSSRPGQISDVSFEKVEVRMRQKYRWKAGQYDLRPCSGDGLLQKDNSVVWNYQGEKIFMKDSRLILPAKAVDGYAGFVEDTNGGLTLENVEKIHKPYMELDSPVIFKGGERIAYRDPAVLFFEGCFHLFFTLVETEEDGGVYMYLAKSKSRDLLHWSEPVKLTVRDRSKNFSSPGNLIRFEDKWVLCFQSYCRENGEKYGNGNSRIYVMESVDLEHFTSPRLLLLKGETPAEELGRMIDPYLLEDRTETGKWWCFYKQNGVSMSYSRDLVHWTYAGHAEAGENVCVLVKNDVYYMFHSPKNGIGVMTSLDCRNWTPFGDLITLGQKEWDWAGGRLTAGTVVEIPGERSDELPYYLMFFHGSGPEDEETMFDQFASIGIAWSQDLVHWEWPGKND